MDDIDDDGTSSHTTGHMSTRMTGRVEIVGRVSGRRRWTVEQKLAILRDAFGPDGSVRSACERHEVGSGQLYTWRRLAMSGELTGTRRTALPAFAAHSNATKFLLVRSLYYISFFFYDFRF